MCDSCPVVNTLMMSISKRQYQRVRLPGAGEALTSSLCSKGSRHEPQSHFQRGQTNTRMPNFLNSRPQHRGQLSSFPNAFLVFRIHFYEWVTFWHDPDCLYSSEFALACCNTLTVKVVHFCCCQRWLLISSFEWSSLRTLFASLWVEAQ